jgi:hypothetical protein
VNRCSHGHLACKFPLNVTVPSSPLETIGDKRLLGRFEELLDLSLRENLAEKQYDTYGPKVTSTTSDDELFDIMCQMLDRWMTGTSSLGQSFGVSNGHGGVDVSLAAPLSLISDRA